mgnify:CR=1 FL=1
MSLIPEGFIPFENLPGHIELNGPYYWRPREDGSYDYGFLSDDRHANPVGVIHGAALLSFVDTLIGHTVRNTTQRHCATVTLNSEFIAAGPVGKWIEGKLDIKKITRSLVFVTVDVVTQGNILLSASSVFKLFGALEDAV